MTTTATMNIPVQPCVKPSVPIASVNGTALHGPDEVLMCVDLHGLIDGQGRSRCVGPGGCFAPQSPLVEAHPLCPSQQLSIPVDPQQASVRVAQRHQVPGFDRRVCQERSNHWEGRSEPH